MGKVLAEMEAESFSAFAAATGAQASDKGCGQGIKFSLYATAPDDESAREVGGLLDGAAADPTAVLEEIKAGAGTEVSE